MMIENLNARVAEVIAKNQRIAPETITPESSFAELNIDSLDGLQIVFALEEAFDVNIPDDAAKKFRTVGEVIRGLELLLAQKEKHVAEA